MLRFALIGYGPIAAYVADAVRGHPRLTLGAVLCRPGREDAARAVAGPAATVTTDAAALAGMGLDFVADCAGHAGLAEHAPTLLAAGIDVLSLSVGALADAELADRLDEAARSGGARLELAPGAVGGIDALAAASVGGLERVSYVARKPPAGWKGTPAEEALDLDALDGPAEHFRGPAREAAARYPKNANVAAMVALAGLGLDATEAVLIADPGVDRNHHEVEAEGDFGRFRIALEGAALPDNPKSSALAAMSMARAIRRRAEAIALG